MKFLLYILFFLASMAEAQNFYTNAPDKVFPVLEEFVSENYLRGNSTFKTLNQIDSIVVKDIPLIVEGDFIKKVYGYYHKTNGRVTIEIDESLLDFPQKFEKTLMHELKHAFGFKDINGYKLPKDDPLFEDLMTLPSTEYFIDPEKWKRMKTQYYNSFKTTK